ncbi:MAG: hypothetical protein HWQ38_22380 [Nostoc sp. NMS7]|uniref:hypothetical protein n=2 Tax=Nostoc TaxID=1177 RepID=UPI0035CBDE1C|nr:hypothetical protein [Nostoc sp. NMS7]
MLTYHRTNASEVIMKEGFKDGTGTYMTGEFHTGVWFSNFPIDANEGAFGDVVLSLDIPEEVFIQYEWVEESPEVENKYRESLIPASIVNKFGKPEIVSDEEVEQLSCPWLNDS